VSRPLPEWIGKGPGTPIPPRVRMRVLNGTSRRCAYCGNAITSRDWAIDHIKPLIEDGENREGNLQPLCGPCHRLKTAEEVARKAIVARKSLKHYGIKKSQGRPMAGTKRSGIRKRMSGKVERW
jgi:5-methylcytosine-specific restriction enzyme A